MKEDGYAQWRQRLNEILNYLMSFVSTTSEGFSACWEIPAEAENATIGKWVKVLGMIYLKRCCRRYGLMKT